MGTQEDQGMDMEQDPQQEIETQDYLKCSCAKESMTTRKNSNTTKALEQEFLDRSQPTSNVNPSVLPELITTQMTMLGEIIAFLQAL